jgi:hypothetical protein
VDVEARDEPAHRGPGVGEPAADAGSELGGVGGRLAVPKVLALALLEEDAGA